MAEVVAVMPLLVAPPLQLGAVTVELELLVQLQEHL
jgi:hypothetical protein